MISAPIILGTFGEKMNLQIQKGCVFGPHYFQMFNPDGVTVIDLTGASIVASIFLGDAVYPLSVQITDAPLGKYTLFMDDIDTALIESVECGRYGWRMKLIDAAGNPHQLYFGNATVMD